MTTVHETGSDTHGAPQIEYQSLPMAADREAGWQALRNIGPVVFINGWYHFSHRDDVLHALRTPEVYSSRKAFDMLGSPLPLVPISFDPPEHTRFRKILQPFFSPNTLGAMLPSLQRQAAAIVDDIAIPYPSQVFLTLYGLPPEDRDKLVHWKDTVIALADLPTLDGVDLTPALELFAYLTEAINERRANPGQDILSQLLTGDEPLDDAEAIGLSYLFVLAGLDTVTAAIGFALTDPAVHRRHQPRRQRRHLNQRRGDGRQGAPALGLRRRAAPLPGFPSGTDGTHPGRQRMARPHSGIRGGARCHTGDTVAGEHVRAGQPAAAVEQGLIRHHDPDVTGHRGAQ
jgi:cytochrome P450